MPPPRSLSTDTTGPLVLAGLGGPSVVLDQCHPRGTFPPRALRAVPEVGPMR